MSVKPGTALGLLALAFLSLLGLGIFGFASGWGRAREPVIPYNQAAKSLPVLQALARDHVRFLRVQDWCRAYVDARERRANELRETCTLGDGFERFDDASEQRYRELSDRLDALPYDVDWVQISYRPDGGIRAAQLSVDGINKFKRDTLVYDPGYTLPEDRPGETVHVRIDADWYYRWDDWL
ncbi:hypothetical protein [Actinoplanes sp. URMC 104]|uniref:hypothetical protein n=1 Tax=Actinoplanes sp. URMC 104 TaxID=3423409 RepID=UPI003F1C26FF